MDEDIADILRAVVDPLELAGISYAVTGSIASGIHGEPAPSYDVDIIVRMSPPQARRLADLLPARFYCDAESLATAAETGGLANLIDQRTILKIDLSVMARGAFSDEVLKRRMAIPFSEAPGSGTFWIVSPEDIILMKLEWRKHTRSEKQWSNALSVVHVQGARLDWAYMFRQAGVLGIEDDLILLRNQGGV